MVTGRRPLSHNLPSAHPVHPRPSTKVEFETDDPALQGEMTITSRLTHTGRGGLHENLPPGVAPSANEACWRMSLDKLARLIEHDR